MFNIGPLEFVVLAAVALLVFGPDKLPQLTKDAGRMLRTLRDLAQGARTQLNSELGPEFADFDLSSLNPRTAIKNALLGDGETRTDLTGLNPKDALSRAWRGEDDPVTKPVTPSSAPTPPPAPPLAAGERAPYDTDAT
ncbi:MAG: sec-independent translocase [Actinomycetota bacterium]|nr:sec-independent translocase [Actinomycetota bacterium]MDQ2956552.1 sec-independent translocase [Actinomycetota bacterium]